jgi:TRAP-type C4-dicarboxylate transport system permease small subunit
VLLLAVPEVGGRAKGLNPRLLREMTTETRLAWLVILGGALITGMAAALVVSLLRGPLSNFLAAVVVVLLLIFASLPIYWYSYRGVPPGTHVSISSRRRYAAPAACLVAALSYSLLDLAGRSRLRKASDAAA